jgi:integrase
VARGRGRRPKGEGSLFQRADGYWVGVVNLGRVAGKRQRRYVYGRTQAEALEKKRHIEKLKDRGEGRRLERSTLGDLAKRWLAREEPRMRQNTYAMHRNFVDRHIVPSLGSVKIEHLTDDDVRQWLAGVEEDGYSVEMRRHILGTVRMILDLGMKEASVLRNVARQVLPPKGPRREIEFLNRDQARAFVEASAEERLNAVFVLAISQGLRLGEVTGLRWRDINFERRQLSVQMQLQWTKAGWDLIEPKTVASRRTIRLTEHSIEALKLHKGKQNEARLRAGSEWEDRDLVFCSRWGTFINRTRVARNAFKRILIASGCPPTLPFHGLRHTFATLKMEDGENAKVVSDELGHASVATTLDLYSHVTPALHKASAERMDRILGKEGLQAAK